MIYVDRGSSELLNVNVDVCTFAYFHDLEQKGCHVSALSLYLLSKASCLILRRAGE